MSADYYVYVEIKNKDSGNWESVAPKVFNKEENKWVVPPVYHNGSRSFHQSKEKLLELGRVVSKDDICMETLTNYWPNIEEIGNDIIAVPFNRIVNSYSKGRKQYSGFVRKNDIVDFEDGNLDELECISGVEYDKLSYLGKMDYEYYEWDDIYGWYRFFGQIIKRVYILLHWYCDVNYIFDLDDSDVRVILFSSY